MSLGAAAMPLVFTTGKNLYLAIITLYMLEMAPPADTEVITKAEGTRTQREVGQEVSPGEKIPSPSPSGQPTISLIFFRVSCSIRTKTGAIS